MRRIAGLVMLGGGLLVAAPAGAYVRTTTDRGVAVHWPSTCLVAVAHVANPPANLTTEVVVTAARAAASVWSRQVVGCSDMDLQVAISQTADGVVANDKVNNVMFRRGEWCKVPRDADEPCYEPGALAITTVFARQIDGVILDADMEVNAVNFVWADVVAGIGTAGNVQDLQNTLTHEFGHFIGLDHNCYSGGDKPRGIDQNGNEVPDCSGASKEVMDATMYASVGRGDTARRTLMPDDAAGVCDAYPLKGAAACALVGDGEPIIGDGDESGGCALLPPPAAPPGRSRSGVGLGLLVALGAFWGALRLNGRKRPG